MKEFEFIENKGMREEFVGRMEVLDKVGNLLLLPNTEYATLEQVSEYYKTTIQTIETVVNRNKDELLSDGYALQKKVKCNKILKRSRRMFKVSTRKSCCNLAK